MDVCVPCNKNYSLSLSLSLFEEVLIWGMVKEIIKDGIVVLSLSVDWVGSR